MDALTILTMNKELALIGLLILLSIFFYLWRRRTTSRHLFRKSTAHHYTEQMPATNIKSFVGRKDVLALLQETWQDKQCHVLALSAWGGTGKSSIINKWLVTPMDSDKPKNVYSWSFHNQGDTGTKQSSSSEFIEHALKFFKNTQSEFSSEYEKATHLATLIAIERNVLILDGLEPFQYSSNDSDDSIRGKLRDTALKALLQQLSIKSKGLCLITTREDLDDDFCELDSVTNYSLENLSKDDCIELLRNKNIQGTDEELAQAAQDYNYHAFSLTLLGNYLSDQSIQDRDQLPSLSGYQTQAEAIFGLMAAYEQHLETHHPMALSLLYLMGLFEHDVSVEVLDVLLHQVDDSNRVGDSLKKLRSTRRFKKTVQLLQDVDLLNVDEHYKLGCHPLTREYFGKKFQRDYSNSCLKAHHVLYDYYKQLPEKEFPDTEEEMEPLFAAITHGCAARLHERVLNEVYWPRIKRGDEHYSTKKLGAFSSDLAALSHFFDQTWHTPAKELGKKHRAGILNWAATRLRALGRLREALEPMQAGMTIYMEESNWIYAASVASSLSGLQLIQGDIKDAINTAEQGMELAYAGDDFYWQMATRTGLADALHQSGKVEQAITLFKEAEALQQQAQPKTPQLQSLWGFRYCDLLLANYQWEEVKFRCEQSLQWLKNADSNSSLLDPALDQLSLGKASLQAAILSGWTYKDHSDEAQSMMLQAQNWLEKAVSALRTAGTEDHLPRGLLARARMFRHQRQWQATYADLHEVFDIAQRGGMFLHLVDYHLEFAHLELAQYKKKTAQKHIKFAQVLIERTGYQRHQIELNRMKEKL
jgi:hypothetical protein